MRRVVVVVGMFLLGVGMVEAKTFPGEQPTYGRDTEIGRAHV